MADLESRRGERGDPQLHGLWVPRAVRGLPMDSGFWDMAPPPGSSPLPFLCLRTCDGFLPSRIRPALPRM